MKRFLLILAVTVIVFSLLFVIPFRNPFVVKNNQILCENIERVNVSQIEIEPDRLIVNIQNISIDKYGNTSSMIPLINENSKGITVKPRSYDEIKVGDVITYELNDVLIVHRVISVGNDDNGWYCIVKGDNTNQADGKIRFEQIKSILIGVLY